VPELSEEDLVTPKILSKDVDESVKSRPVDPKEISFKIESINSSEDEVSVPLSLCKKQIEH